MKTLLFALVFVVLFGISVYFLMTNSDQSIELVMWGNLKTPSLPVGLVVLIAFFLGMMVGLLLFPLTYVIKRLSS